MRLHDADETILMYARHAEDRAEHGTIMAANVLNSPRAVEMSVYLIRVPQPRDHPAPRGGPLRGTGAQARGAGSHAKNSWRRHPIDSQRAPATGRHHELGLPRWPALDWLSPRQII